MMLRHYTYREFVKRPGRTLLTLGGIVIGVAGVFAIALTIDTTRTAYQQMFADLSGTASLEVVADGGGGFDATLADELARVPGVRTAKGVVQRVAGLVREASPLGVMVVGCEAAPGRFVQGHEAHGDDELVLVENFARSLKLSNDDAARLVTPTGVHKFRVAGQIEPTGMAGFNGGAIVFVSLPTARRIFKLPDQVTAIPLELDDEADVEQVKVAIAEKLPAGISVRWPATRGDMAQHSLLGAEQGLTALSAVSIVAGAFVILNAFLMSLGERRKQLAILRAIGVTSGQITRLLLREALILGVVGMLIGIGAGMLTSVALIGGMERLMGIQLHAIQWTAEPFCRAALVGPGISVLATLVPAIRAGKRPPLADLLGQKIKAHDTLQGRMPWIGLVLLILTAAGVAAFVSDWVPSAWQKFVTAPLLSMFLVSGILLTPAFYPFLARVVAKALAPVWGVTGRLAVRHLERNSMRSGLTAAILCVALVISIAMGQSIRNSIQDVEDWSERTFTADYMVRGSLPELSYSIGVQLPESMHDELAAIPGVEKVHQLNMLQVKANGEGVIVLARSFDEQTAATLDVAVGDREAMMRGLLAGDVVIGTSMAQRLKLHVGDSLGLHTRRGVRQVRIAGQVTEYVAGGMALFLKREKAKELFNLDGVDVYMLNARPGELEQVGAAVQKYCDARGLMFQSNTEFRERIRQMMGGVIGFLWLLMALVFVVASLGIVNTLTMNVMEQTREIAVLRSVALVRNQVRAMVFYQALSLSLCSLVPGIALGLMLAFLMNLSTHVLLGQPVEFYADPWFIAGCCLGCLLIASAAALLPARRAARLQIVAALQYE